MVELLWSTGPCPPPGPGAAGMGKAVIMVNFPRMLGVDYRLVMDERWYWPEFEAEAFVGMISSLGFLGDPCIKTQHLLGATWWEYISDTEVIGHHQLRAAHLRYTSPDLQRVSRRGHGHATNEHYYRKVAGIWKFAGLRPEVRWNEYDFDLIFKGIDFGQPPATERTEDLGT